MTTTVSQSYSIVTVDHTTGIANNQNQTLSNELAPLGGMTGSIPIQNTTMQVLRSQVNVSLSEASTIAEDLVAENSSATAAVLNLDFGFLAYIVYVDDSSGVLHRVVIDAGNGDILSSEQLGVGFTIHPPSLIGEGTQGSQESLAPFALGLE